VGPSNPTVAGTGIKGTRKSEDQRREFHEALLDASSFEDLPGRWQATILKAEQNRPRLRVVAVRDG
jgi:hypothetical protein